MAANSLVMVGDCAEVSRTLGSIGVEIGFESSKP